MSIKQSIDGSSAVGIFYRCTEDVLLMPQVVDEELCVRNAKELKVDYLKTSVNSTALLGAMICGNSNGLVVSRHLSEREFKKLAEVKRVKTLPSKYNAVGNLVLVNDLGAYVSPLLSRKARECLERVLMVDVSSGTIAGIMNVGMAAAISNKGILAHPDIKEDEIENLERTFGLPVGAGTINLGSPFVGAGVVANSNGLVVGSESTGYEIGQVEEYLI